MSKLNSDPGEDGLFFPSVATRSSSYQVVIVNQPKWGLISREGNMISVSSEIPESLREAFQKLCIAGNTQLAFKEIIDELKANERFEFLTIAKRHYELMLEYFKAGTSDTDIMAARAVAGMMIATIRPMIEFDDVPDTDVRIKSISHGLRANLANELNRFKN